MKLWLLSVVGAGALASACQGDRSDASTAAASTEAADQITIANPAKALVVTLATKVEPCRASIDGVELIVGVSPIVAQLGATNWTGETSTNGTTFKREGTTVARAFAASDHELALFDPEGAVLVRAVKNPDGSVSVSDRQSTVVRTVTSKGAGHLEIAGAKSPTLDVRGTDDALLAAIAAAPEAIPEVRALAACNRLFPRIER